MEADMEWNAICRICLHEGDLKSIFELDELTNTSICHKIMLCSGIQIRKGANFPEHICDRCNIDLNVAYKFRMNCESSDAILQSIIRKNSTIESEIEHVFVYSEKHSPLVLREQSLSPISAETLPIENPENLKLNNENALLKFQSQFDADAKKVGLFSHMKNNVNEQIKTEPLPEDKDTPQNYQENYEEENLEDESSDALYKVEYIELSHTDSNEYFNDEDLQVDYIENNENTNDEDYDLLDKFADKNFNNTEGIAINVDVNDEVNYNRSDNGVHEGKNDDTNCDVAPEIVMIDDSNWNDSNSEIESTVKVEKIKEVKLNKYRLNKGKKSETGMEIVIQPDGRKLCRTQKCTISDKPLKICDICGSSYKFQHALDSHMRRHRNEKPFVCSICGRGFVINFELNRHMRTHTGQKPYKCTYCDRCFSDFGSRIKHERTHTGERPYRCTTCGKTFAYSNVLTSHYLIHTGEKKFSCDMCDKKFAKSHHLKAHLNTHRKTARIPTDSTNDAQFYQQIKENVMVTPRKQIDAQKENIYDHNFMTVLTSPQKSDTEENIDHLDIDSNIDEEIQVDFIDEPQLVNNFE